MYSECMIMCEYMMGLCSMRECMTNACQCASVWCVCGECLNVWRVCEFILRTHDQWSISACATSFLLGNFPNGGGEMDV